MTSNKQNEPTYLWQGKILRLSQMLAFTISGPEMRRGEPTGKILTVPRFVQMREGKEITCTLVDTAYPLRHLKSEQKIAEAVKIAWADSARRSFDPFHSAQERAQAAQLWGLAA